MVALDRNPALDGFARFGHVAMGSTRASASWRCARADASCGAKRGVLITETKHGFICANSGVDVSNVDGGNHAVLLPANPDRSAAKLRRELKKQLGIEIAVIVSDSFGRPWREGLTEVAIGVAGMRPLVDYRGRRDPHGYSLHATIDAVADELACAAGLVCGKLAGTPACIIRGYAYQRGKGGSAGTDPARARTTFFG